MKTLIGSSGLVVASLALAACGGSNKATALPASLVKPLAAQARSMAKGLGDPSVKTVEVYGPNSRHALVQASSSDTIPKTSDRMRFYLIVIRGHFVCDLCSGPPGMKPSRGTIATSVWSARVRRSTDFGLSRGLPETMSRLGRPAVISLR